MRLLCSLAEVLGGGGGRYALPRADFSAYKDDPTISLQSEYPSLYSNHITRSLFFTRLLFFTRSLFSIKISRLHSKWPLHFYRAVSYHCTRYNLDVLSSMPKTLTKTSSTRLACFKIHPSSSRVRRTTSKRLGDFPKQQSFDPTSVLYQSPSKVKTPVSAL